MRKTTKKRKTAPRFTGELATPIVWTGPNRPSAVALEILPDAKPNFERETEAARERAFSEMSLKIGLLAEHYGVNVPSEIFAFVLLFRVCQDLIPGFKIERAKSSHAGRRKIWDWVRYTQLLADVDRLKSKDCKSDRAALRKLVSTPRYCPKAGRPRSNDTLDKAIDTLETRLGEARRADKNPMADAITRMREFGVQDVFFDAYTTKMP